MCRLARPRVKKSRFGRQGNWGEGRRPLQSCCVIALPYVATRRAHIYLGQSSDAGAGRGGIFGKATLLSRCALTPAGLARPGDSGDGRLTSILDAVTEARDSSYCGVREGDGRTLRI